MIITSNALPGGQTSVLGGAHGTTTTLGDAYGSTVGNPGAAQTTTLGAIPEISANKYMLWVRFTMQDGDMKPKSFESDVPFELTLCNF